MDIEKKYPWWVWCNGFVFGALLGGGGVFVMWVLSGWWALRSVIK